MSEPVVYPYQLALDTFRREGRELPLLKRMSELISLLDLSTSLNSCARATQTMDAALLVVMGELGVTRGALLARQDDKELRVLVERGLPSDGEKPVVPSGVALDEPAPCQDAPGFERLARLGFEFACPVRKGDETIALFLLGARSEGEWGEPELNFLRSLAACAAAPIENALIYEELRRVNHRLSAKVFQLQNIFDVSRELTSCLDEEAIKRLVVSTVMGHLAVSRCALWLEEAGGLVLAHERGARSSTMRVPREEWDAVRKALSDGAVATQDLPVGALRDALLMGRLSHVFGLELGRRGLGLVATGPRVSGTAFGDEDTDFVVSLGRQALAALEGVVLHRVQAEKQRQDRELQLAREIQQALLPRRWPAIPGFDVAAESLACREVGGDYYDILPLPGRRIGLVVTDVSGKGVPASLLMASVHASLRALAGSVGPAALAERLSAFLVESTQDNRYATLFYGELDPGAGRLVFVNAGHVPPLLLRSGGRVERLTSGGPPLGLIESATFEQGEVSIEPGDVLAAFTDGVTEALSPTDIEFGEVRVLDVLAHRPSTASAALGLLLTAVREWTAPGVAGDDLTALVLRAA